MEEDNLYLSAYCRYPLPELFHLLPPDLRTCLLQSTPLYSLDPGKFLVRNQGRRNNRHWHDLAFYSLWYGTLAWLFSRRFPRDPGRSPLYCYRIDIRGFGDTAASNVLFLVESLAAVGRTVSEVAHDMKTPLMAIGGFAAQVSRALDEDDPKQKKLQVIVQETGRLETMVREMLDFGKPAELQLKRTNLNDLVQEVIDAIRPVAEKAGVILDTDFDPLLPPLMLDGPKVKQAFLNLVVNALEASPAGEHVFVKTAGDKERVSFFVTDDGAGIDIEDVERIFEPFFSKKSKGTGLGLPIVKKIVETHGGQVFVHPNQEKGATFTIMFPIKSSLGMLNE